MSAGNFFLYLNHDDHTDMRALATIESVSRPLRGEFIRTAAVAGAVLYRIDVRLPSMLVAMSAGTINTSQFSGLLAVLQGTEGHCVSGEGETYPWIAGRYTGLSQRRRLVLQLNDESAGIVIPLLDDASDRQRLALLRSLMIAGCVLHELDPRFPRLLASMPEPPATLAELQQLTAGLFRDKVPLPRQNQTVPVQSGEGKRTEPASDASIVRNNMKKLF
ncbi:plasmid partitioning/stability family protein [Vagococcus sp. WN89Y]|uniref:plasmid partitioning/stability family protein n=1 Tax=Vagococcus sp. WN89Y TaxID=3457258 RepID=UPI003FCE22BF